MLTRLPYRLQIPLGLSLAVVVAALLVTVVTARLAAGHARQATLATVDRAVALLVAQSLPLLAADDTWRVFALLRSTAALLPGADAGHARAAVLDAQGRVFAASQPALLAIGLPLLGQATRGPALPAAASLRGRHLLQAGDGALTLVEPVRSEDGQALGHVYVEVDAAVFAPDWAALSRPALIGAALAVLLLVPLGWWTGRRMTQPVGGIARFIERIGHEDPAALQGQAPHTRDPELGRIAEAAGRLIREMQVRQQAEQRALSAERMAAVGRLTAAVAHEINNPLGGLLNAAQTLRLHGASETTRLQTLSLIERGLQQIRATVAALVPQARVQDRSLELNDLADVVRLVLPLAERQRVDLRSHAEVAAALHAPSSVVRQVMLNLLVNATKAAGDGGWVSATLAADAQRLRFCVCNSGQALDAAALEAAITAESGNDPRGFGLWVCREIATQFGGGFAALPPAQAGGCLPAAAGAPLATALQFWIPNQASHAQPAVD